MPELPEVEITRRGIAPALTGRRIASVVVRERRLRRPVPRHIERELSGLTVDAVDRRGKYLLLRTGRGTVILHLGMSGNLCIVDESAAPGKHDHLDFRLEDGTVLRFRDQRRFGLVLWTTGDPLQHELLRGIGPEPLGADFSGEYLYRKSRGRRVAIKQFLMDAAIVAGVGNIYANEALWSSGVHPARGAGRISAERYGRIAEEVVRVLEAAIRQNGTTLRDFYYGETRPGEFGMSLAAYGRAGLPCSDCGVPIRVIRQGQRATYYCPRCQR